VRWVVIVRPTLATWRAPTVGWFQICVCLLTPNHPAPTAGRPRQRPWACGVGSGLS